ncbi:LPS translocon maturation chaperone LptM [Ferrimonas gelatinilytica]|uniref:Lipoprotein-attachment site-containing protein n=1 Tax=Ferrimonas gelatinilytica TaxID=1255257 RepID=A0ABP9RVY3_9GAMM
MRRTPLVLALLMALSACGQTGPLYLPESEPVQDNAPAAEAENAPEEEVSSEASNVE